MLRSNGTLINVGRAGRLYHGVYTVLCRVASVLRNIGIGVFSNSVCVKGVVKACILIVLLARVLYSLLGKGVT